MILAIHSWPDSISYESQWMKGFKHGNGQFYTKDGYLGYDGEWEWGEPYGRSAAEMKLLTIIINSRINILLIFNFNIKNSYYKKI